MLWHRNPATLNNTYLRKVKLLYNGCGTALCCVDGGDVVYAGAGAGCSALCLS